MNRAAFSPGRVTVIAGNTFREAARQRLLLLFIMAAATMAGGALFLGDLNFGSSELKFLMDVGFGALTCFGAILAIVASAQLFASEIERRTVLTVLAKPVWRAEFVFGKLGGVLLLLLVFCVLVTALLTGVLWGRETLLMKAHPEAFGHGRPVAYASVAVCGLVQWLKLGVLAALTMFVASYARSSLFVMMAGFCALVIGHLQYLARDFYGMMDWPWERSCLGLLGLIFPNFQLFNVADKVAAGEALSLGVISGIAMYALAYMGVFSGLAVYCFHHREL